MKEYHKIRWIYKFDSKTHLPIQEIDEYFNNLKSCRWIFTEKIDWTNIRIVWDWHNVSFYWRTDNAQLPWNLLNKLKEIFIEELFEQNFWETNVVLYWEWFGGKIQKWLNDYWDKEDFILFDVEINWIFLERENIEWVAKSLWINLVPILLVWTLDYAIKYVKDKKILDEQISKTIPEWLVWVPIWWYLDRLWNRIIVKIKQGHFRS